MIEDMKVRKFAAPTQENYIRATKGSSAFLGAPPDTPSPEDLHRYRLHLVAAQPAWHRGTDGPVRQARLAAHAAAQLDNERRMRPKLESSLRRFPARHQAARREEGSESGSDIYQLTEHTPPYREGSASGIVALMGVI